ncbi:MAG: hypothetical protein IGS03_16770 [Candidatus Sericytochromatia bacterium]|nr:hypothetical protein [Candidatus Sericytochromatia bacterium]
MRVEVLIDTLVHDNERIALGAELDLEPEQAQQLLDVGAVRAAVSGQGSAAASAKTASKAKTPGKPKAKGGSTA